MAYVCTCGKNSMWCNGSCQANDDVYCLEGGELIDDNGICQECIYKEIEEEDQEEGPDE